MLTKPEDKVSRERPDSTLQSIAWIYDLAPSLAMKSDPVKLSVLKPEDPMESDKPQDRVKPPTSNHKALDYMKQHVLRQAFPSSTGPWQRWLRFPGDDLDDDRDEDLDELVFDKVLSYTLPNKRGGEKTVKCSMRVALVAKLIRGMNKSCPVDMQFSQLKGADLRVCFGASQNDFCGSVLKECYLGNKDERLGIKSLRCCELRNSVMACTKIVGVDLSGASIRGANFEDVNDFSRVMLGCTTGGEDPTTKWAPMRPLPTPPRFRCGVTTRARVCKQVTRVLCACYEAGDDDDADGDNEFEDQDDSGDKKNLSKLVELDHVEIESDESDEESQATAQGSPRQPDTGEAQPEPETEYDKAPISGRYMSDSALLYFANFGDPDVLVKWTDDTCPTSLFEPLAAVARYSYVKTGKVTGLDHLMAQVIKKLNVPIEGDLSIRSDKMQAAAIENVLKDPQTMKELFTKHTKTIRKLRKTVRKKINHLMSPHHRSTSTCADTLQSIVDLRSLEQEAAQFLSRSNGATVDSPKSRAAAAFREVVF